MERPPLARPPSAVSCGVATVKVFGGRVRKRAKMSWQGWEEWNLEWRGRCPGLGLSSGLGVPRKGSTKTEYTKPPKAH